MASAPPLNETNLRLFAGGNGVGQDTYALEIYVYGIARLDIAGAAGSARHDRVAWGRRHRAPSGP